MSQSSAPTTAYKPRRPSSTSKTGRRQFRSCDQCRRGKRACDIAISDDVVAGGIILPPLEPCSTCAKTRKTCTIEWLSAASQALQRAKEQRSSAETVQQKPAAVADWGQVNVPVLDAAGTLTNLNLYPELAQIPELPLTYTEGPQQQLDSSELAGTFHFPDDISQDSSQFDTAGNLQWDPENFPNTQGSSYNGLNLSTERTDYVILPPTDRRTSAEIPASAPKTDTLSKHRVFKARKKRRQFSPPGSPDTGRSYESSDAQQLLLYRGGARSPLLADPSSAGIEQRLAINYTKSFISGGLLKIYHDSMENALSCWLTERTCPYVDEQALTTYGSSRNDHMLKEWGPGWTNRICERVCQLDKAASSLRTRALTKAEDKAAGLALKKSILAFATQWANSSSRSAAEFSDEPLLPGLDLGGSTSPPEFDRSMQETFWNEARDALRDTVEIESFRVIFAHIIFSLTQKPLDIEEMFRELKIKGQNSPFGRDRDNSLDGSDYHSFSPNSKTQTSTSARTNFSNDSPDHAILEQILGLGGPPVFLETALRQIFSFRCKLERMEARAKIKRKRDGLNDMYAGSSPLSPEDRQTFDLLFWLGIMFDTLSSAMNMRPLVVSDEDSDVHQPSQFDKNISGPEFAVQSVPIQINVTQNSVPSVGAKDSKLWDDFLLKKEKTAQQEQPITRWPCSYDIAAATLCDAAPIKVLLYRKVTRLQTLVSRRVGSHHLELAISDALSIHNYWNTLYGPFMNDCILNHENLPARVQSWYIILCGHWHLAEFLLADTIKEIDEEELGLEIGLRKRTDNCLVENIKRQNAYIMSDLGRASCPRTSDSFPRSRQFHDAVNKGALLTEPWTEVLVRSFTRAGSILVDLLPTASAVRQSGQQQHDFDEIKTRCSHCIEALWHLGKKSDIALLAYKALSDNLEDKVDALKTPSDLGGGVNGLGGGFGNCDIDPSNFNVLDSGWDDILAYLSTMKNEGMAYW